jgi:hypothetical protein
VRVGEFRCEREFERSVDIDKSGFESGSGETVQAVRALSGLAHRSARRGTRKCKEVSKKIR